MKNFYNFLILLGSIAACFAMFKTHELSDGWSFLWWYIPFWMINCFACFAMRDKEHERG